MSREHLRDVGGNAQRETNFVLAVTRALACSLEVFFHRTGTFGARYLGPQVALAIGIIFCFPIFVPHEDPTDLYGFLMCFIVMCLIIKGRTDARLRQGGDEPHSYYTGRSRLFFKMRDDQAKLGEPFLALGAAACLNEISPLLARYLAFAGAGLFLSVALSATADRKRLLDMHDAYAEQRHLVEQWRSRTGRR